MYRMDAVFEPTKQAVLEIKQMLDDARNHMPGYSIELTGDMVEMRPKAVPNTPVSPWPGA